MSTDDELDLHSAYRFPSTDEPWVRASFVASADGAATLNGRAGGLGNETDRRLFALLRALADVVLVGAGTARTEDYGPVEDDPEWSRLRAGRSRTAPIAVVSRSLDLDPASPLFAQAPHDARTIVITAHSAPAERLAALREVADVIIAGQDCVDLSGALDELVARGLTRISCEGGPTLFSHLAAADLVDELCLTLSPKLVSGGAIRIMDGPALPVPVELHLHQVLTEGDYLFLRYLCR